MDHEDSTAIRERMESELSRAFTSRTNFLQSMFDGFIDGLLQVTPHEDLARWLEELRVATGHLQAAQRIYREEKERMTGADRRDVGLALHETKEKLDREWSAYKDARRDSQRAFLREKIERLEEVIDRKRGQLGNVERQISDLDEKIASAWSDGYREKAEGWREEAWEKRDSIRASIDDIDEKVSSLKSQLDDL